MFKIHSKKNKSKFQVLIYTNLRLALIAATASKSSLSYLSTRFDVRKNEVSVRSGDCKAISRSLSVGCDVVSSSWSHGYSSIRHLEMSLSLTISLNIIPS